MTLTHRFLQLSVLLLAMFYLAGCAQEGPEDPEEEDVFIPDRLPFGLPVFEEIVEPFIASFDVDKTDSVAAVPAVFSFDPDSVVNTGDIDVPHILSASDGLFVSLNTVDDIEGRDEITILSSKDSIYKVNHQSGELRMLNHFAHKVCEILPVETLVEKNDGSYVVLHEELVYVVVVLNGTSFSDCNNSDYTKLYYELALNYQFDAGESSDETNDLPVVKETKARSELIMGWVDNPETSDPSDKMLDYGYLGYSFTEQKLRFYDAERIALWEQSRELESFDSVKVSSNVSSPKYIFSVTPLTALHYKIQLGRDVFVVDASTEFFNVPANEVAMILSDRVLMLDYLASDSVDQKSVLPAYFISDDTRIVFENSGKLFLLNYLAGKSLPSLPSIKQSNSVSLSDMGYEDVYSFSQFDIESCDAFSDVAACEAANTADPLINASWQFITSCDASSDCELDTTIPDLCVTLSEWTGDPAEIICTPSDYRHITELNDPVNDAEFLGYMQYAKDYIKSLELQFYANTMLITARMNEHDVLLRYFYEVPLTEPKGNREQLIFGERLEHHGLDTYVSENNLFVTSLMYAGQERVNECYKNYKQVPCNSSVCVDFDPEQGETGCINGFKEYESTALFCSAQSLADRTCSDDEIAGTNTLSAEQGNQDARWLQLNDFTQTATGIPKPNMFLFVGDEQEVQDEGVLVNSRLIEVEDSDGTVYGFSAIDSFDRVESVPRSGAIYETDIARVDVISEEIRQDASGLSSQADLYFVVEPLDVTQSEGHKVGEFEFLSRYR